MPTRKSILPRIVLDCVLIVVLVTLYSKNVISLMFHEVVGLIILGLFLIHIVFNRKWIGAVVSKLSKGKVTGKSRVMMIVNALLVISWAAVFVTGILVSKKVFPFEISSLNPWHFFSAALALVFTGIHFGLHWNYFWGFLGKRVHLPRVIAVVLCFALIGFGAYSLVTSSFGRWMAVPFTPHEEHGGNRTRFAESVESAEGENVSAPDAMPAQRSHGQEPFSLANFLKVVATWFSVLFLFAACAHGVELLATKKQRGVGLS